MSLLRFAVSSSATEEAREARRAQQKAVHKRRRSEAERLRFAYPPGRTKRRRRSAHPPTGVRGGLRAGVERRPVPPVGKIDELRSPLLVVAWRSNLGG